MASQLINIRSKTGIPLSFKFVAIGLIILSLVIIPQYPIFAGILAFFSLLILTARSGIEIDLDQKTLKEYNSYFYIVQMGKPEKYEALAYLFINSANVVQTLNSPRTLQSARVRDVEYNLFLKLSDGDKIKLWSQKDKEEMLQKGKVLSNKMNVELIDYTENE